MKTDSLGLLLSFGAASESAKDGTGEEGVLADSPFPFFPDFPIDLSALTFGALVSDSFRVIESLLEDDAVNGSTSWEGKVEERAR